MSGAFTTARANMKQSDAQCAKYAQASPVLVDIMRRSRIRDDNRPCPYKYKISDDEIINRIDKIYNNSDTIPLSRNGGVCRIQHYCFKIIIKIE